MRDRAIRRNQHAKLRRRWTRLIRRWWGLDRRYLTPERAKQEQAWLEHQVHARLSARQPCSCWMCGHRRRTSGPTRQERLDQLNHREQLERWCSRIDEQWEDWWLSVPFYGEDFATIVDEGFEAWWGSLPDDDWNASYAVATPMRWDSEDNG